MATLAGAAVLHAPPPTHAAPARRHLPNVPLRTQDDREVRFYDDLIRGKIVLINMMYAECTGICPAMTTNLLRVQRLLGDRVGRNVFMYSITLKPEHDTPAVLRRYATEHGIGPGWTFLTGKPADVDELRRRLGFVDPDPAVDQDTSQHTGMVRIGNDAIGSWTACPALGPAEQIVRTVGWMDV